MHGLGLFVTLCLLYFCALILKRMLIIDSIAAFEILEERGEMWVFDLFFGLQYLAVPVFLTWKFTLTSFVLWVGCFMFGYRLTYSQVFKLILIGELLFIVPEFLKIIWFSLIHHTPDYRTYVAFYPLSLSNFIAEAGAPNRWTYPLKALNLFEIAYWFYLMGGVYWLSGKKWKSSILIVSSSYILFLFIWIVFYLLSYK